MRIRLFGACAAVALAAGLVGCTGEEDPGPQTIGPESSTSATESGSSSAAPSSAAPPTAPKPAQTFPPEQQPIVDAYYGYFDALFSLRTQTDDEVRAAMTPYAVPERVEKVVQTFATYRAEGKEPGGSPGYRPIEIAAVSDQASTIVECHDGSQETMVDIATGQVIESGVQQNRLQTELVLDPSGSWLVDKAYWEVGKC
ncbi:hypothetical protein GCM10027298_01920 [Epidermidibacterium keratini]